MRLAAIALLLLLAAAAVQTARLSRAGANLSACQKVHAESVRDYAIASAQAHSRALEIERTRALASAAIAQAYEKGKDDARTATDRVAADLRAGNIRLRDAWAGCETDRLSAATASAAGVDAAASDRAGSAGRIIGAAAACDAQVTALQALVRADREMAQ